MINKELLQKFFDTAWARHRIYVLKELGCPKPWTLNKIFQENYFCNVFRRLDKTSKWIIEHAIAPNVDNPDLWMTILMCRYISKIETLQELEDAGCLIGNRKGAFNVLRGMQREERKIFTNAFIVNSRARGVWMDKVSYLFRNLQEVNQACSGDPDVYFATMTTIEEVFHAFYGLPGIGPFMAYQYAIDFTYSKRYFPESPTDELTWTELGLGAKRGMNRLLGNLPTKHAIPNGVSLSQEILVAWQNEVIKNHAKQMYDTYEIVYDHRDVQVATMYKIYEPFYHLDMSNVEHWLCEFDKYMRGGSKKRRYRGGA